MTTIEILAERDVTVDKLRVNLTTKTPAVEYVAGDLKVTGTDLVIAKTTATTKPDLIKRQAGLAIQIAALQAEKAEIDALIPLVQAALDAKVAAGEALPEPVKAK